MGKTVWNRRCKKKKQQLGKKALKTTTRRRGARKKGCDDGVEDEDAQELSRLPDVRAERNNKRGGEGVTRCRESDNNEKEPAERFEGLKSDADWKIDEQTKSGAPLQRVTVVLQKPLQAFMDERLNAGRMREQVAKEGRWILQLPLQKRV